ncbi:hypothetical protein NQ315_005929 [Exocentrus adspersus]|uniref:Uncharacterized protein n=1 Tax=Exocentrus adspersus TaxID=1586481 RepID=A0AAV8VDG1_9CUCU|nr:hypothetical protein NQ315_005929 [Exocentrus adspersus]
MDLLTGTETSSVNSSTRNGIGILQKRVFMSRVHNIGLFWTSRSLWPSVARLINETSPKKSVYVRVTYNVLCWTALEECFKNVNKIL